MLENLINNGNFKIIIPSIVILLLGFLFYREFKGCFGAVLLSRV